MNHTLPASSAGGRAIEHLTFLSSKKARILFIVLLSGFLLWPPRFSPPPSMSLYRKQTSTLYLAWPKGFSGLSLWNRMLAYINQSIIQLIDQSIDRSIDWLIYWLGVIRPYQHCFSHITTIYKMQLMNYIKLYKFSSKQVMFTLMHAFMSVAWFHFCFV